MSSLATSTGEFKCPARFPTVMMTRWSINGYVVDHHLDGMEADPIQLQLSCQWWRPSCPLSPYPPSWSAATPSCARPPGGVDTRKKPIHPEPAAGPSMGPPASSETHIPSRFPFRPSLSVSSCPRIQTLSSPAQSISFNQFFGIFPFLPCMCMSVLMSFATPWVA